MKRQIYETPNKLSINTGHKTFDRQTNCLCQGNILANTIYGKHIRPKTANLLPPYAVPLGYLQDWDCQNFIDFFQAPKRRIIGEAKKYADEYNGCYLYCVFHVSRGKQIIHGYIFSKNNHKFLDYQITSGQEISRSILKEVALYITENSSI